MAGRRSWLLLAFLAGPLTAAQHRETFTYSFDIDPGEARYFDVTSREADSRLKVQFEVQSPQNPPPVRVAVQSEEEFRRFREHQPHREISSSPPQKEGTLKTRLPEAGRYIVVIENRMERRRKCRVEMLVVLMTGPEPETLPVEYASPRKRLIVVTVSVACFLLILALSGKALWRAAHR